MKEIIKWIGNNSEVVNLLIALITMFIIIWYAVSTKRIANKTADSVEATKELINVTL